MWLFGTLDHIEKDVKNSVPVKIDRLIKESGFSVDTELSYYESCPLVRFVLHYRYGLPGLSGMNVICRGLDFLTRISDIITPRKIWSYIIYDIRKK